MTNATTPLLPMEGTEITTITSTLIATITSSVSDVTGGRTQKNTGNIAGGVVAGIVGLSLVACGIWLLWKRMKARRRLPSGYISTDRGNWDDTNRKGPNLSRSESRGWNYDTLQRASASQGTKIPVSVAIHTPFYPLNRTSTFL